jgi:hypothetical protein
MLTAVAVRRDVIDPDLFHCDLLGQFFPDTPGEADLVFRYSDPCALLPVLHRGRIVLARWGCRRNESRDLPCTGWTTSQGTASRFWREVGGRTVTVPAYLGYEDGEWVPLRSHVQAVLAYDSRGQAHAYIVCEPSLPPASRFLSGHAISRRLPSTSDELRRGAEAAPSIVCGDSDQGNERAEQSPLTM